MFSAVTGHQAQPCGEVGFGLGLEGKEGLGPGESRHWLRQRCLGGGEKCLETGLGHWQGREGLLGPPGRGEPALDQLTGSVGDPSGCSTAAFGGQVGG